LTQSLPSPIGCASSAEKYQSYQRSNTGSAVATAGFRIIDGV
jgi:hypothetical protein